jgi:hypothetical protein
VSWLAQVPGLSVVVSGAQFAAASPADDYLDEVLAAQDSVGDSRLAVEPRNFAGVASDGRDLMSLLYQPAISALTALASGTPLSMALATGAATLDMITRTQVADAGRAADGVALTARRTATGYVRVLSPPSCSRCVILAGKRFRWNDGFLRHPRCDCLHLPTTIAADLTPASDPEAYFRSLSRAEQDRTFTRSGAQAVRDGADLGQVVNARRGMTTTVLGRRRLVTTTEGTTTRGLFGAFEVDAGSGQLRRRAGAELERRRSGSRYVGAARAPRLMPEEIYKIAGDDRGEAVRLLRRNGYLTGPDPVMIAPAAARKAVTFESAVAEVEDLVLAKGADLATITSRLKALGSGAEDALAAALRAKDPRRLVSTLRGMRTRRAKPAGTQTTKTTTKTAKKAATKTAKVTDLSQLTVTQLRELARAHGISGLAGLRKADIVAHLRQWEIGNGKSLLGLPKVAKPAGPAMPRLLPELRAGRRFWRDVYQDTGLDAVIQVRNLEVQGGYVVRHGSVWRIDGTSYLVEHAGPLGRTSQGGLRDALEVRDQLIAFHRSLPAGRDDFNHAYLWLSGRNPADAHWEKAYNMPDFTSLATGGDGAVTVWGRASYARPDSIASSLHHELGHNVDTYATDLNLGSSSVAWTSALAKDAKTSSRLTDFTPSHGSHPLQVTTDHSKAFPHGVTSYARTDARGKEDFAESTALYFGNQIGTGRLGAGPVRPIYFRDLFPSRAAILDDLFPAFAKAQRAALAKRR